MGTWMISKSKTATILMGAVCLAASGIASAEWTKSFAVEWIETASYYGADSGVIEPGTDCPKGSNPEPDWVEVLVNGGYTRKEAEWIRNPANPDRSPVTGNRNMALRGKDFANVYREPWTYPDPGLLPMEGDLAEGINLDGDSSTGFTSLTGEQGIDNNFYRALGCWKTYRGPERLSSGGQTVNNSMRNGSWTMLIVLEGEGDDPMNDENVRVGLYQSDDSLIKTGNAKAIARDYTFVIKPHERYGGIFEASIKNGRVVSDSPIQMTMRDPSPGSVRSGVVIEKAQIDFTLQEDGTLEGYIGGYREWAPVYMAWGGFGQVNEVLTWIDLPAAWYALERNADYSLEGSDKKNTHISFALRVNAIPAFVMTPDATKVASVQSYKYIASE